MGGAFFLNIFYFFLSGGKNDFLKSNKISHMSGIFWRKILEKDFQIFPECLAKFVLTLTKMSGFT